MNPETIATKAVRLTPVAVKRLRNAGLNRIFIVKSPSTGSWAKHLSLNCRSVSVLGTCSE